MQEVWDNIVLFLEEIFLVFSVSVSMSDNKNLLELCFLVTVFGGDKWMQNVILTACLCPG